MAITEPAQFTTEKNKQAFRAIVFIDFASAGKYWANEALTLFNGHTYENELVNVSAISATVDRDGGLATVGGLTFDLSNLEDYSDWLAGAGNLEGEEIKFYLVFNDGTTLTFSESVQYFTGLIDSFEINYDRLSISVSHYDLFLQDMVGELIQADDYTDQLSSSIGQMKPVVYGDHSYNGPKSSAQWNPLERANMIPCIQITANKFIVSGHELGSLTTGDIWLYHSGLDRYFNIDSEQVTITNPDANGDCIIEIIDAANLLVYDYWQPYDIVQSPAPAGEGAWINTDNVLDNDLSTSTTFDGTVSGTRQFSFLYKNYDYDGYLNLIAIEHYSAYDLVGGTITVTQEAGSEAGKVYALVSFTYAVGDCTFETHTNHDLNVGDPILISGVQRQAGAFLTRPSTVNAAHVVKAIIDNTHFTIEFTPTWSTTGFGGSVFVTFADFFTLAETTYGTPTLLGQLNMVSPEAIKSYVVYSLTSTGIVDAGIRCVFKKLTLVVSLGNDFTLCAAGHGKKDGLNYITNPIDITKDIVTSWTNLTYANNFDSTAFTAAQTARTAWGFNFILTAQRKVKELVHSLTRKSNVYSFWNNENKLKLIAYTQNSGYTANVAEFSEVPGAISGAFNKNRIIKGTLRQRQTSVNEFANKIYIEYFADIVSGKYNSRMISENTTSQAIYGITEKDFENEYITDNATAELYAGNLIDIYSYRMWFCQFDGSLQAYNVEIGDIIDIDNFISDSAKYIVISNGCKPITGTGRIAIQCVEQKDTSGDTITHTSSDWSAGQGMSGSGRVGAGSGSAQTIYFWGSESPMIRGVIFYDQFGQPFYEWREASGNRVVRKTSRTKP